MKAQSIQKGSLCMALLAGAMLVSPLIQSASAGLILQDQTDAAGTFHFPDFKGQTFTAEDPFILTIGIGVMVANAYNTSDTTINMTLFSGRGNTGPVVASRTIQPAAPGPNWTRMWADFDFSGVELTPGNLYSFTCSAPTPYWFGEYNILDYLPDGTLFPGQIDYPGGEFFIPQEFRSYSDMRFRVVPVPEPSTCSLLAAGLGFLSIGAFRNRRKVFHRFTR